MPFPTRCPAGHSLVVPSRFAGQKVNCPRCRVAFVAESEPAPSNHSTTSKSPPASPNAASSPAPPLPPLPSSTLPSPPPSSPPPLPPRPLVLGVTHREQHVHAVYLLGMAVMALAIFGAVPAFRDVWEHLQSAKSSGVATWAYLLLLLGGVQLVYAVYVMQLPDWSSVGVVTIVTLLVAMLYATVGGALLVGAEDNRFILTLALNDRLREARLWCLSMTGMTTLLAYFSGRMAVNWRHEYQIEWGDRGE